VILSKVVRSGVLVGLLSAAALYLGGAAHAQQVSSPALILPPLDSALAENIEAHLEILKQGCDVSLVRVQRLLPQAREQLKDALEALGYYHGKYALRVTRAEAEQQCWQLEVDLEPGPQVLLGEVQIRVVGDPETQALFADTIREGGLASGTPLHHGRYEDLKSALSSQAADEGYFDARFERSEIALDLVDDHADIALVFNPGTRYRFGAISLTRPTYLSDALIDDLMAIHPGDPYSSSALADLRRNLDMSQYFREIRVTPAIGQSADRQIPVAVELQLRARHAWTGGLGFTTDTGPRARFSYENRYVNRRGHRFRVDSTLSSVRSQVDGAYTIPLSGDVSRKLVLSSGYNVEDTDSYKSKRLQSAVTVTNETDSGWQQSAFLELLRDDYEVGSEDEVSLLLMPGVSLSKTSADDIINPRRGWKLFSSLRVASESVISDTTFAQLYGSAKYIHSFGRARVLTRAEGASTWIGDVAHLPASLRYFTGGDQSIRGYDFRELGPLNAEHTEVVGGRHLLVGSIEMDYRILDSWRVAVFTDAGNAFNTTNDLHFKRSAGIGVRWLSPIGPIRIDLAHPFDGEDSVRLHITMGPDL